MERFAYTNGYLNTNQCANVDHKQRIYDLIEAAVVLFWKNKNWSETELLLM
jgi:hypothetical protein